MFTVYYSNQLETLKEILIHVMTQDLLKDPLQSEVILVQSNGMAQWLQWQIAEHCGIAANLTFSMPASFIWQQYQENFPNMSSSNAFSKENMTWHLMQLIPDYLSQPEFQPLYNYLASSHHAEQQKRYQLANKIADLFDQYLVYRSHWITAWEENKDNKIAFHNKNRLNLDSFQLEEQINQHSEWQGILWRALVNKIKENSTQKEQLFHRVDLNQKFLELLKHKKPNNLPQRIFIFGIPTLPKFHLETLYAISQYCEIHLFFYNPCREYWADIVDQHYWQKLQKRYRTSFTKNDNKIPTLSPIQIKKLENDEIEYYEDEKLQIGHPLLSSWGKLGRDFLHLLTELQADREINAYVTESESDLLHQIQTKILDLIPNGKQPLFYQKDDRSLTFHSCYSAMREVEALHDYLLHLFNQNQDDKNAITPKDIVVMVADIDKYTPYIRSVFGQRCQNDSINQQIPFSISDNTLSEDNIIISGFLNLLNLKESLFTVDNVLTLLDIPAIHRRFNIEVEDLAIIKTWIEKSGIRFGLQKATTETYKNYNAWQAGIERMLLGYAMREEHGIWQDTIGFDSTYGLQGQLIGNLSQFIEQLYLWQQQLSGQHSAIEWGQYLYSLIENFFIHDENTQQTIWYLNDIIQSFVKQLQEVNFNEKIIAEVVADIIEKNLTTSHHNLKFLAGKVNFCTLLPMRSIPFKVVCLLGMNENDYPRRYTPNSFDLMQYNPQKGDRNRRDDDRYLFLEALLSAQKYFYISYIGRSIIDDQEKEPSVLVNQLIDYIVDNIDQSNDNQNMRSLLVTQHSMTAFSQQNFIGEYRSFKKQWLPLAQNNKDNSLNFIKKLDTDAFNEIVTSHMNEIELTKLIQFICHPTKFFFENILGVYFYQEELIPECENFTLDNLELYKINNELIYYPNKNREIFFEKLKIKGSMPQSSFSQVYQNEIENEIDDFKENINIYLQKSSYDKPFKLNIDQSNCCLKGTIDCLYETENAKFNRVTWRVGKVKDYDYIYTWIHHLVLCAIDETQNFESIIHYGKDKAIEFNYIDKNTALQQLQTYVDAYLQGQKQLFIVINKDINNYIKIINNNNTKENSSENDNLDKCNAHLSKIINDNLDKCNAHLSKIIFGDQYTVPDRYLQRVFAHQKPNTEQIIEINERTFEWFNSMILNIKK